MREIKFRALDVGTDEWLYFTLRDLIVGDASKNLRLKNWCRYTGLLDRNKKEIYEGDIVKYDSFNWVIKIHDKEPIFIIESWFGFSELRNFRVKNCEVIGNIYENPKLLKEEK